MFERSKKLVSVMLIIAMTFTSGGFNTLAFSPFGLGSLFGSPTNGQSNTSNITSSDDGAVSSGEKTYSYYEEKKLEMTTLTTKGNNSQTINVNDSNNLNNTSAGNTSGLKNTNDSTNTSNSTAGSADVGASSASPKNTNDSANTSNNTAGTGTSVGADSIRPVANAATQSTTIDSADEEAIDTDAANTEEPEEDEKSSTTNDDKNTTDDNTTDDKSTDNETTNNKSDDNITTDDKATDNKATDDKSADDKSTDDKVNADTTTNDKTATISDIDESDDTKSESEIDTKVSTTSETDNENTEATKEAGIATVSEVEVATASEVDLATFSQLLDIKPATMSIVENQLVGDGTKFTFGTNWYENLGFTTNKSQVKSITFNSIYADTIKFGTFNNNPIEWKVAKIEGDAAFLISKGSLTNRAYHSTKTAVTWETSDIRKWLNGEFYNNTFTSEEKSFIVKTNVVNDNNPTYGTSGGNNTSDNVFLLSIDELFSLLSESERNLGYSSFYWLRSPGSDQSSASVMAGESWWSSGLDVNDSDNGVRPAIRINLSSYLLNPPQKTSDCKEYHFKDVDSGGTADIKSYLTNSGELKVYYLKDKFTISQDLSNAFGSTTKGTFDNVTYIDMSQFDVSNVTNMSNLFAGAARLRRVYVGDGWSTGNVQNSTNMFRNAARIKGGLGTKYNSSHIDKEYARIDQGESNPGYFTDKKTAKFLFDADWWDEFEFTNNKSIVKSIKFKVNSLGNYNNKPIKWRVLDGTSYTDKTFILSDVCVAEQHIEGLGSHPNLSWHNSFIRSWLNNEFYNNAFTNEEKSLIAETTIKNNERENYSIIDNGKDTTDKIFLLSVDDVNNYLPIVNWNKKASRGATYNGNYVGWWLRTCYNNGAMFYHVSSDGDLRSWYSQDNLGIRPALWINKPYSYIKTGYASVESRTSGYTEQHFLDINVDGINDIGVYLATDGTLEVAYNPERLTVSYDLSNVFKSYNNATSIDISSLDISNVTNMSSMFSGCTALTSISKLNTNSATNMSNMFDGCAAFTSLDLSEFNTSNVTDISGIFNGCAALKSLDLSKFDTKNVTNMSNMFNGCTALTNLDLKTFDTSKVTNMSNMFNGCSNLKRIYVDIEKWSTKAISSSAGMFTGCTSLSGIQKSAYDSSHVDATYAHVDRGTTGPGYLSVDKFTLGTDWYEDLGFTKDKSTIKKIDFENKTNLAVYFGNYNGSPIKWRVLDGATYTDRTLIISEDILTERKYYRSDVMAGIKWEKSDIRSWLNNEFLNEAFSSDVQPYIRTTELTHSVIDAMHVSVGNDDNTQDKIFLLSMRETATYFAADDRIAKYNGKPDYWWLRTRDSGENYLINGRGAYDAVPSNCLLGIRPALWVDFSSTNLLDSNGYINLVPKTASADTHYFDYNGDGTDDAVAFIQNNVLKFYYTNSKYISSGVNASKTFGNSDCGNFTNVTEITGLTNFNFKTTTDMSYMFDGMSELTSLDITSFDTGEVTNMSYMFNNCSKLASVYIDSGWRTPKVTTSDNMFYNCTSIKGNYTVFDSNHIDKTYARKDSASTPGYFIQNNEYTYWYLDGDTLHLAGKVPTSTSYNMGQVFTTTSSGQPWSSIANSIKHVIVDDTDCGAAITSLSYAFNSLVYLESADLTKLNVTNGAVEYNDLFANCSALVDVKLPDNFAASMNTNVQNGLTNLFYQCTSLEVLDLTNISNTSRWRKVSSMFYGCTNLKTILVSSTFNISGATDSADMFYNCNKLVGGKGTRYSVLKVADKTYAKLDKGLSDKGYFTDIADKGKYLFDTDWYENFGFIATKSEVKSIIFKSTPSFLDSFTVPNAADCKEAPRILDADNDGVNDIGAYLTNAGELKIYYIENKLTISSYLSNAFGTTTKGTFDKVTSIDIKALDMSVVGDMSYMFAGAESLTSLDLSTFNTSKVIDMSHMFDGDTQLKTIYVSSTLWSTTAVTSSTDMFKDCVNLKGFLGTKYNSFNVDATYARVDKGATSPGYLTDILGTGIFVFDTNWYEKLGFTATKSEVKSISFENISQSLPTGDFGNYNGSAIKWRVLDGTTYSDRTLLISEYILDKRAVHNIGNGTLNITWEQSELRQWLNSYFLNTAFSDVANSFIRNTNVVTETNVDTGTTGGNDTVDKIFILSKNEANNYFADTDARKVTYNGVETSWWLRTRGLGGAQFLFINSGIIDSAGSTYQYELGVRPALWVDLPASVFQSGYADWSKVDKWDLCDTPDVSNCKEYHYFDVDGDGVDDIKAYLTNAGELKVCYVEDKFVLSSDLSNTFGTTAKGTFDKVTAIDISTFDTSNVAYMSHMFENATSLKKIYVNRNLWNTSNVRSDSSESINGYNMFKGAVNLKGGLGTKNTNNDADVHLYYAHIDGGLSSPGYLTDKNPTKFIFDTDWYEKLGFKATKSEVKSIDFETVALLDTNSFGTDGSGNPIKWRVLNTEGDKALLISDNILMKRAYNGDFRERAWENSDIRRFLNNDFLNDTFADAEKTCILDTNVKTAGQNDTTDKVFILSYDEATNTTYFSSDSERVAYYNGSSDVWILRTPGDYIINVAAVRSNGSISMLGYNVGDSMGIRPALWVDLSSYVFKYVPNISDCKEYHFFDMDGDGEDDIKAYLTNAGELKVYYAEGKFVLSSDLSDTFGTTARGRFNKTKSIDISIFDTSGVTDMTSMFAHAASLSEISVEAFWNTTNVTASSNMFDGCISITGGKGTKYDPNYIDKTFARVDEGDTRPGYLSTGKYINWELGNGGWVSGYNPPVVYDTKNGLAALPTKDNIKINDVTRAFGGWEYNGSEVTSIPAGESGVITIKAIWDYTPRTRVPDEYVQIEKALIHNSDTMSNGHITEGLEYIEVSENYVNELSVGIRKNYISKINIGELDTTGLIKINDIYYSSDYRRPDVSSYKLVKNGDIYNYATQSTVDVVRETDVKAELWYDPSDTNNPKYILNLYDGDESLEVNEQGVNINRPYGVMWDLSAITSTTVSVVAGAEYDITWVLGPGDWATIDGKKFDPPDTYKARRGLELPTADKMDTTDRYFMNWEIDGATVHNISRTATGKKTIKAVWLEKRVKLDAALIRQEDGFNTAPIANVIKPTASNWRQQLGFMPLAGKIKLCYGWKSQHRDPAAKYQIDYYSDYKNLDYRYSNGYHPDNWDVVSREGTTAEIWYDENNDLYTINLFGMFALHWAQNIKTGREGSYGIYWDLTDIKDADGTKNYIFDVDSYTLNSGWYEAFGFTTAKESIKNIKFVKLYNIKNNKETKELKVTKDGSTVVVANGYIEKNGDLYVVLKDNTRYVVDKDASNFFGPTAKGKFTNVETIVGIEKLMWDDVTTMKKMFEGCASLREIDLSHINTYDVENMDSMFKDCSSMTVLDLSYINMDAVNNTSYMFSGMTNLTTIYVASTYSNKNIQVSTEMFSGNSSLTGGESTPYTSNNQNKEYARIDKYLTNGTPGYFTEKGKAKISSAKYDLTWEKNGGEWAIVNGKVYEPYPDYSYGVGIKAADMPGAKQITKANDVTNNKKFTFSHWTINGVEVSEISATRRGNLTLVANWTEDELVVQKEDIYFTLPERIISNDDAAFTSTTDKGKEVIKPTKDNFVSELGLYSYAPNISAIEVGLDTTGLNIIQTIKYQTNYRRVATNSMVDNNYNIVQHDKFDPAKGTEVRAEVWYDKATGKYKINLINGNNNWKVRDEGNTISELFDYEIVWDLSDIGTDVNTAQQGKDYSKKRFIKWDLDGGEFVNFAPETEYEEGVGLGSDKFPGTTDVYKKGFILNNWTLDNAVITEIASSYTTTNERITIKAGWRTRTSSDPADPNEPSSGNTDPIGTKYKITWDLGNADAHWADDDYEPEEEYEYGIGLRLPGNDKIVWYGHKLTGWNIVIGGKVTDTNVDVISSIQKGNATVVAQWRAWDTTIDGVEKYDIEWDLVGGVWQIDNYPRDYEYGKETDLPDATTVIKNGNTFEGWYIGSSKVNKIPSTTRGKIKITASWKETTGGNTPSINPGTTEGYVVLPKSIISVADDSFTSSTDKGREKIKPTTDWATELSLTDYATRALGSYDILQNETNIPSGFTKIDTIKYMSDFRRSTSDISIIRSSDSVIVQNTEWDVIKEDKIKVEIWKNESTGRYIFNLMDGSDPSNCRVKKDGTEYAHEVVWDLSSMVSDITVTSSWYEDFGFDTAKNNIRKIHFVTEYTGTKRVVEEKTRLWTGSVGAYTKGIIDEDNELYIIAPSSTTKLVVGKDATNFFGNTAKGTFERVTEIEGLDKLDWSKVENMDSMFIGMATIEEIDISAIDTSNVTNMSHMFADMKNLETIYVDNFDTSKVSNSSNMFDGSIKLLGGEGTVYDRDHVDMSYARIDKRITSNTPGYFTEVSEKGNPKAYPSSDATTGTYYNIYWDLDGGAWVSDSNKGADKYLYGTGLASLPTKDQVSKAGYTLSKWTYDNKDITSISTTDRGSITIKAVWVEAEAIIYKDGDVRPDIYVDLPERIISTNDDNFRMMNYRARDTIKPTSDWATELSLSEYETKIDEIGVGINVTGLKKVQTINYRSAYRRDTKFATTSDIEGTHRSSVTGLTNIADWDLIKDSEIKAEVYWDEANSKYKVNLVGSNGDWRLRVSGAEVIHEVIWDLGVVTGGGGSGASTKVEHRITWNLNSGRWVDENYTPPWRYFEGDGLSTLPGRDEIERYGYEFLGWTVNNIIITSISPTMSVDITLTASWKNISVKVTLDANEGQFDDKRKTKVEVVEEGGIVGFTEPKRTGYKFRRWVLNNTNTTIGSIWDVGAYGRGSVRIRAEWEPISYNVVFDGMNSSNPYAMYAAGEKLKNLGFGQEKTIDTNLFIRKGYIFNGWLNRGKLIGDSGKISMLTDIDKSTEILRADWVPMMTDVRIARQFGRTLKFVGTTYPMPYGAVYNLKRITTQDLLGYKFLYWKDKSGKIKFLYESNIDTSDDKYIEEDEYTAYYAVQSDIVGKVTFDGTGGKVAGYEVCDIPVTKYDSKLEDIEPYLTRPGYKFLGWEVSGGKLDFNKIKDGSTNYVVKAKWAPQNYMLIYEANDGSGRRSTPEMLTMGTNKDKIIKTEADLGWSRPGYKFVGWGSIMDQTTSTSAPKWKAGNSYETFETLEATIVGTGPNDGEKFKRLLYNQTYVVYAQWEPIVKNIEQLDEKGKKLTGFRAEYGQHQNLTENTLTKSGYTFVGWATEKDGDVVYRDRDSVDRILVNEAKDDIDTISLYARFELNKDVIDVIYNANGGTINGFKTWKIKVKKGEDITKIASYKDTTNGKEQNTGYMDRNRNTVTIATRSTLVYANYTSNLGNIEPLLTTAVSIPYVTSASSYIAPTTTYGSKKVTSENVIQVEEVKISEKDEKRFEKIVENQLKKEAEKNAKDDAVETDSIRPSSDDAKADSIRPTDDDAKADSIRPSEEEPEDTDNTHITTTPTNDRSKSTSNIGLPISKGSSRGGSSGGSSRGGSAGGSSSSSASVGASYASPVSGGSTRRNVANTKDLLPANTIKVTENRPTTNIFTTAIDTKKLVVLSVASKDATWIKEKDGKWSFRGKDKSNNVVVPKNTFCQVTSDKVTNTYYFDDKGNMVVGWMKTKDGKWYYFGELEGSNLGVMAQGWTKIGNSWYYFTSNGSLFEQGVTPDGLTIGKDGKWQKEA